MKHSYYMVFSTGYSFGSTTVTLSHKITSDDIDYISKEYKNRKEFRNPSTGAPPDTLICSFFQKIRK